MNPPSHLPSPAIIFLVAFVGAFSQTAWPLPGIPTLTQIKESYGKLFHDQFRQLFALAEGISWEDLQTTLDRLQDLDLKLKTTNLVFQTLMEGFLFEYCWMRRYGRG